MACEGADISHFPRWPMSNFETLIQILTIERAIKQNRGRYSRSGRILLFLLYLITHGVFFCRMLSGWPTSRAGPPPLHQENVSMLIHGINNGTNPPQTPTLERCRCCRQTFIDSVTALTPIPVQSQSSHTCAHRSLRGTDGASHYRSVGLIQGGRKWEFHHL